jgi:hypothetical protein
MELEIRFDESVNEEKWKSAASIMPYSTGKQHSVIKT